MNAKKLTTVEEHVVGTEDRVFSVMDGKWYWQCRGSSDSYGPFDSREEAESDYAQII